MHKKIILLGAAVLALQALPAFAEGGRNGGPHPGKDMFAQKDTNGDGVVSKDEFLSGAEKHFQKMDENGDGEITKDEARKSREKMKEKMKNRRQKWEERQEDESEE
ncbi:MAG: EF-hand domain-containing protein [Rhodospirillales bacterium]|nr:EF-hand domain-containing protein [Alphaproteobacteria bacterium]USO03775.1 MAG: EF-hand domain-containing protein [Rhodospirillales bacterium]